MKRKIIIPILFAGAVLIIAGCQKKSDKDGLIVPNKEEIKTETEIGTQDNEKAQVDLSDWKTYDNEKYSYQIKYPKNWFFVGDYCCPPPPAAVNLNSYSSKKLEYANHQMDAGVQGINIDCLYEGKIDDISEVQLLRSEGKASKMTKVNGFDAIRFEHDRGPASPSASDRPSRDGSQGGPGSPVGVITYYVVDGQQGCRLGFESTCTSCENIVSTFKF